MVMVSPKYKGDLAKIFSGINNGHVRLAASEPFKFTPVSKPDGEILVVEGFASTDNVDRGNEVVDPAKFDLEQITTTTAVLINHKLWMNREGNAVAPGSIKQAYHVKVRRGSDAKSLKLYDVNGKSVLKEVSKKDFPGMTAGDAGLYVVVEVYDPDVIKAVKAGQLQAFSWRGHVKKENAFDMSSGARFVTYGLIDCWEISLVNVPVNPTSTLLVRKSAISAVCYGRDVCTDQILADLKSRDLEDFDLLRGDSGYYAVPKGFEPIQKSIKSFVEMPIGNGLSLLVDIGDDEESKVESFKSLFGDPVKEETNMSEGTQADGQDTKAIEDALVEAVKSQIMGEISPMITSQNEAIKSLTDTLTATATTVATFDGKFEEISKSLSTLTSTIQAPKEEPEKKPADTTEVVEDAKSVTTTTPEATVSPDVAALKESLVETQKSIAILADTMAKGMSKLVPASSDREESLDQSPKSDNDVFNTLFGIV